MTKMPTYDRLMSPVVKALLKLGGSGSIGEINDKVLELENIPEEIASRPHDPERWGMGTYARNRRGLCG